jgi:hypothetical protein
VGFKERSWEQQQSIRGQQPQNKTFTDFWGKFKKSFDLKPSLFRPNNKGFVKVLNG